MSSSPHWFSTSNSSIPLHSRPALPYSMGVTILFGLAAGIISLVTIFGNTIVILSFFLEQSIRQPTNYFIASLAVSDLLIGAVSMPFYTIYLLTGQYWPLNEFLCNVWLTVDYTACMCSIYTVFSITVDRYCSVKIPAKYRIWRTKRKVLVVIACIWAVSVLLFFSSIFLWQTWISDRKLELGKCYVFYLEDALFNCSVQVGYFWITIMAMITLYIAIYRVALDLQRKSEEKHRKTAAVVTQVKTTKTAMGKSETGGVDSLESSQVKRKTPSPTEAAKLLDERFSNPEFKNHGSIKQASVENSDPMPNKDRALPPSHVTPPTEQKEGNCEDNSKQETSNEALRRHENLSSEEHITNPNSLKEHLEEVRMTSDVCSKEIPPASTANVILKQSFSIDFRPGKKGSHFEHELSTVINPVKSWSFDGILESFVRNKAKQEKIKRFFKENKQTPQNSEKNPSKANDSNHSSHATNDSKEAENGVKADLTLIKHISVQLCRATELTGLSIKKFSTPQMGDLGRKLASKLSISTVLRNIRVPDAIHELLQNRTNESQTLEAEEAVFMKDSNNLVNEEDVFLPDPVEKSISCSVTHEREDLQMKVTPALKKYSKRMAQGFHDTANLLNSFEGDVELQNGASSHHEDSNKPQPESEQETMKTIENITTAQDLLPSSTSPQSPSSSPQPPLLLSPEPQPPSSSPQPSLLLPPEPQPPPKSSASNCLSTPIERMEPATPTVPRQTTNDPRESRSSDSNEAQCVTSSGKLTQSNSSAPHHPPSDDFGRLPFSRPENQRSSGLPQSQSGAYTTHQKHKRANRARKALRTITIILGAFIVCFLPWHVLSMIMGFCPKNMVCVSPVLYDISYWLCYLNSPINPFCYALANEQFKRTFARILRLDWHRI